jgi:hypothetical protein
MIRNKTYRNFTIIKNKLVKDKGYEPEEASKITHQIFENVWFDKDCGNRPAEFFYNLIIASDEYHDHR